MTVVGNGGLPKPAETEEVLLVSMVAALPEVVFREMDSLV